MGKIDLINTFVKMFVINFFIYLTYGKITDYKNKSVNYIIILITSAMLSAIYIILNKYLQPLLTIVILYIIYGIIINKIIGNKINYIAYIVSCITSYVLYLLSVMISATIILLFRIQKNEINNPVSLILIPLISSFLLHCIFKIKRFKNGFNFIKNIENNRGIKLFTILFTGITLIIFGLLQKHNSKVLMACIAIGIIFTATGLIIWIKSQITKTYKNRMRDRTIEIQKTEIDEQTKVIEEVKAENIKLATAIHKYNKKFSSLEFAMKKALELESKTEFANEISTILEEYQNASKNFAKEVEVNKTKLPETNIAGIDNMFKYMQEEARKKDINFDLKLNTKINPLIETIISKDKFETLIGDHLKDAIIAVDASSNAYKSILATLGLVNGIYEFSVYDTGIEFEIETLLKLGKEQVTTHKDEGGSGIGFMTTFETLKECKASLIIEEYNPEATNYTKAVIIRFDGKSEYKICSYRAEKIKERKHKRRIIIENLK